MTTKKFLVEHPTCSICGSIADTREHSPAKVIFVGKNVPGIFEFPACERCNNGSSQADQIVALTTLVMGSGTASHVPNQYVMGLAKAVKNNAPTYFNYFRHDNGDEYLRVNGLVRKVGVVALHPAVSALWLDPWATKVGCTFWYKHMGEVFSPGYILTNWITNTGMEQNADFIDDLSSKLPGLNWVSQGRNSTKDQFFYRYAFSESPRFAVFLFCFHDSAIAFVILTKELASFEMYRDKMSAFSCTPRNGVDAISHPI